MDNEQTQAWIDLTTLLNDWRDRHGLSDIEMLNALEIWIALQAIVVRAVAELPTSEEV